MSDDRLDAEWVRSWCEQTSAALGTLMSSFLETHGFPPGRNVVMLSTDQSSEVTAGLVDLISIPSDLTALYRVICEVSLPDVDSGYFIHSPSMVVGHVREYGSVQIEGEEPALVFASDGGGHLFAVAGSGHIWRSITASWFDDFEVVAAGLQEFLERLGRRITSQG